MGYSLSWIAIRGKDPAAVRRALGLRGTGNYEEIAESPLVGAELPTGWYLVVADHHDLAETAPLAELSVGGEAVVCFVEEHVMVSAAMYWRHGTRVWSVVRDSQQGAEHLETEGELPREFIAIADQLSVRQASEDDADYLFDIPIEIARVLTGYRHDQDIPGAESEPYERLEKGDRERKWWELWR